jgi:hypothetical protein
LKFKFIVGMGPSDLQDLSSSISSILGFGVMLELDVVGGSELSPEKPVLPDSQLTSKVGAGPTGLGSFSSLSLLSLPLFELLAFEIELSVPRNIQNVNT